MDSTIRILMIDDDVRLSEAVARFLGRSGYEVSTAGSGAAGLERFAEVRPHLVILDVMMPGRDGWEICRRLRETSEVPIIMLTARDSESDKVMGLRMGADDYLGKPFSLKELEARVEAVLRRSQRRAGVPESGVSVLYDDGHLRLEQGSLQVTCQGKSLELTATEHRLLFTLVEHANQVLSNQEILRRAWGGEYEAESSYVKLYVWRLRQKIELDPSQPRYIRTERGFGYRFVPQAAPPPAPVGA